MTASAIGVPPGEASPSQLRPVKVRSRYYPMLILRPIGERIVS